MDYDVETFKTAQAYANKLKADNGVRISAMKKYKDAYELKTPMEAALKALGKQTKIVVDPSPRTKVQGAKRLLTSTTMVHQIPRKEGLANVAELENYQHMARNIWAASGWVGGTPVEEDGVFSGLLYDEVHLQVVKTQDILDHFEKGVKRAQEKDKDYKPSEAQRARIERLVKKTPFIIEVLDPSMGYAEWDRLGLRRYYYEIKVTRGYMADVYGVACKPDELFVPVYLCSLWDLKHRHIWMRSGTTETDLTMTVIVQQEHGLPFIPVACTLVDGSRALFHEPDEQRQPFLYTMLEGGIWDLNTLYLSVMATNAKVFGVSANFLYTGEEAPTYESTGNLTFYKVGEDEVLAPLDIPVNQQMVQDMYALMMDITTKATMYDHSLGGPGASGDPFSKTALLHQAGRLPLVGVQRQVAACAAEAVLMCFWWMKHEPQEYISLGEYGEIKVQGKDIPEWLTVKSKLEIDLPQDQLEMAQIVGALRDIMGDKWVMENVLSVEEPERVIDERSDQRFYDGEIEIALRDMTMENQMKWQNDQAAQARQSKMEEMMMMQQAQGGGPPGGVMNGPQQDMEQQEAAAMMAAEAAGVQSPGMPSGITPEMEQAMMLAETQRSGMIPAAQKPNKANRGAPRGRE